MTFYVDACALVHFQFHPRSVGRSVDPSTTSQHFGAETKIMDRWSLKAGFFHCTYRAGFLYCNHSNRVPGKEIWQRHYGETGEHY